MVVMDILHLDTYTGMYLNFCLVFKYLNKCNELRRCLGLWEPSARKNILVLD